MPQLPKLTDEQIRWARQVGAKRVEALRQARMYPTIAELAEQLGCSERYLRDVLAQRVRTNLLTPEQSA